MIYPEAALNKDIVSQALLFAGIFCFRVLYILLSIRIDHRRASVWEIYVNVLQSDLNLFSLLIYTLPVM